MVKLMKRCYDLLQNENGKTTTLYDDLVVHT